MDKVLLMNYRSLCDGRAPEDKKGRVARRRGGVPRLTLVDPATMRFPIERQSFGLLLETTTWTGSTEVLR